MCTTLVHTYIDIIRENNIYIATYTYTRTYNPETSRIVVNELMVIYYETKHVTNIVVV